MTKKKPGDLKPQTLLVTAGRDPADFHGFVNPPVYHASTVLYPNAADMVAHRARYQYGRRGTPTSESLENALRELEGPDCAGVALLPSGAAAVSNTVALSTGDLYDKILAAERPRAKIETNNVPNSTPRTPAITKP